LANGSDSLPGSSTGRADFDRVHVRLIAGAGGSSRGKPHAEFPEDVLQEKTRAARHVGRADRGAPDAVADAPIDGAAGCVQGSRRNTPTSRRGGSRQDCVITEMPARVILSPAAPHSPIA